MKTWLIASALAAAALAGCGSTATSPAPKNVIFFLGDGMGMTTQTAARIYKVGEDGELTMDTLPETAFVKTYSNNAQVTDSAPSMAAYMTGVKMNNEVISMTPETSAFDVVTGKDYLNGADSTCPGSGNGKAVTTLLEIAKAAGMGLNIDAEEADRLSLSLDVIEAVTARAKASPPLAARANAIAAPHLARKFLKLTGRELRD
mgnify:CR=1 FL=1